MGGRPLAPSISTSLLTLYQGHVLDVLRHIPDGSIDCIVTSPPYWALRAYSTEAQVWGGRKLCAHSFDETRVDREMRKGVNLAKSRVSVRGGAKKIARVGWQRFVHGTCSSCGDWRGELGLEPTPELYVAHMLEVFRALRRVLTKRGTLWLNMGDSYASAGGPGWQGKNGQRADRRFTATRNTVAQREITRRPPSGLKSKDLLGMPWRVAFALQADGWWLRSDIVWYKPNPMPESVRDRPTRAHEYIFLMARSAHYYYDAEAISEPVSPNTHLRVSQDVAAQMGSARANGGVRADRPLKAVLRDKWPRGWASGTGRKHDELVGRYTPKDEDGRSARLGRPLGWRKMAPHGENIKNNESMDAALVELVDTRNARSVWTINTQAYPDAHFATFPEELPRRAILAGCPERVCATCGKARERVVERQATGYDGSRYGERAVVATGGAISGGTKRSTLGSSHGTLTAKHQTTGWTDCGHNNYRPGVVLDPFAGSGTTLDVANALGRRAVGIELSSEYVDLIRARCDAVRLQEWNDGVPIRGGVPNLATSWNKESVSKGYAGLWEDRSLST